ncbi:MAG: GTPase Era [Legionellaceae bacterium]
MAKTYCGFIALIGRPNVGKSTLLNALIGEKISITSRKPQTTRHKILGIRTEEPYQAIFVDTPGLHEKTKTCLNKYMNRAASSTLNDVDAIFFIIEAHRWKEEDENVLKKLKNITLPIFLIINKCDRINEKNALNPLIEKISAELHLHDIFTISAKNRIGLTPLIEKVHSLLPSNPFFFPKENVTDRNLIFFSAELIREKLIRNLGEELPYSITVEIEKFTEDDNLIRINGLIWVEKENHKQIVIGKNGFVLKKIGQATRIELERKLGKKVYLELWVKVKASWSNNESMIKSLGYEI